MERHFRMLGCFFAAWAVVGLTLIYFVPQAAQRLDLSREMSSLVVVVAVVLPEVFSILAAWTILTGVNWYRPITTIASLLVLPVFPVGTALGIFGLWVIVSHRNRPGFSQYARFDSP